MSDIELDIEKRLEEANVFKTLLAQKFVGSDVDPIVAQVVENKIKNFIKSEIMNLMGLNKPNKKTRTKKVEIEENDEEMVIVKAPKRAKKKAKVEVQESQYQETDVNDPYSNPDNYILSEPRVMPDGSIKQVKILKKSQVIPQTQQRHSLQDIADMQAQVAQTSSNRPAMKTVDMGGGSFSLDPSQIIPLLK